MIRVLVILLILAQLAPAARARQADTLVVSPEPIAFIPNARRVAADAEGTLYVVAESEVVLLDVDGRVSERLDGAGIDDGAFNELADIGPGAGLIWVLADAGSGKLMRFSRTLLHLESILVPPVSWGRTRLASRKEPRNIDVQDVGRPVAVATAPGGDLFAIEENARRVLKWDASRRFERVIGGPDARAGQLQDPVSLAADAECIYVADRGAAAVLAYDHFGGFVRSYKADDSLADVWVTRTGLGMVLADEVWIVATGGLHKRVYRFEPENPLVSAVTIPPWLFVLTQDTIWRVKL